MMVEFYENEAQFKALLGKVENWETLSWMTQTNTKRLSSYVPPLTESEASEIQKRMIVLGIQSISVDPELRYEGDAFIVHMRTDEASDYAGEFWRRGLAIANKGYAYLEEPLPRAPCVLDKALNRINLDKLRTGCHGAAYRHIDGNWYLYMLGPEST